jgi:hypothetical protein
VQKAAMLANCLVVKKAVRLADLWAEKMERMRVVQKEYWRVEMMVDQTVDQTAAAMAVKLVDLSAGLWDYLTVDQTVDSLAGLSVGNWVDYLVANLVVLLGSKLAVYSAVQMAVPKAGKLEY